MKKNYKTRNEHQRKGTMNTNQRKGTMDNERIARQLVDMAESLTTEQETDGNRRFAANNLGRMLSKVDVVFGDFGEAAMDVLLGHPKQVQLAKSLEKNAIAIQNALEALNKDFKKA